MRTRTKVALAAASLLVTSLGGLAALLICPPEEATLRILDARDLEGWFDPDLLVQAVTNATGEDEWDEPASITYHQGQLVVHQTPAMHDAIDKVLAKLRVSHARSLEARHHRD